MAAELHEFLARDHERLDALLQSYLTNGADDAYQEFRAGLLRHIAIEERVLFPLLRKRRGATELERQLHRDHAALAAILVPPPSPELLRQVVTILEVHNVLEEEVGGLYEMIEELSGEELASLVARAQAIPPVRVAPNADSPVVRRAIEQLVREAEEGRQRWL